MGEWRPGALGILFAVRFGVTFSVVRCTCGAERQAARVCGECGREPEETDELLERRRAIVARVERRRPQGELVPLVMPDAFGELREWYAGFEHALESVDEGTVEEAAGRLQDAFDGLDRLERRTAAVRRLRPMHGLWRTIDAALDGYARIRDTYVDALTASTVGEVEAEAKRGQEAIDAAGAAMSRLADYGEAFDRVNVADPSDEFGMLAAAREVAALAQTSNIIELDASGAEKLARIAGEDVRCPAGFGVRLHLLDLVVEGTMDPDRFWSAARHVYELLQPHPEALARLYADEQWRDDFVAVTRETLDAGFEASAVAAAATENRRRLIQSALRLAARVIERVVPPLLATLIAVEKRRLYASERSRDFNSLLQLMRQDGRGDLLLGFDAKLRDADSHGKFEVDDDGVRLTGDRGNLNYLTDDELVDVTLAATESVVALHWGILTALVTAGIDADELDEALAADVAAVDKVKLVLLLNGWRDVEVESSGASLVVRGTRDAPSLLGLIAAVGAVTPAECETLTLVAADESGTHNATGPVESFHRANAESDEVAEQLAFVRGGLAWHVDGQPIITRAHAEKVYAFRAVEALNPDGEVGTALRTLRTLLDAARDIDSPELVRALTLALRHRREAATGTSSVSVGEVVQRFDPWLVQLPALRSAW